MMCTVSGKTYLDRLPLIHRLDISLERTFGLVFGDLQAQAGALNLYDRTHMLYYDVYTHRRIDQLPLIPYASVKLQTG